MTAWPTISRGLFDTGSDRLATTAQVLTDATEHAQEVAYIDGTHSPTEMHVHTGNDSVLVVMPDAPNLVTDAHPQATQAHDDVNDWSRSGVGVDEQGLNFLGTGTFATIPLGDAGDPDQFAGCDIVIALLARSRVPLTALTFNFGIVDGNSSSFGANLKASFDQSDMPVGGYRRFYTVIEDLDTTSGGLSYSDVRLCVSVSGSFSTAETTFDRSVDVTAVCVKPCNVLPQWEPGYFIKRQHNWELIGMGEVPLWDDVLNFDRALYGAPA